MRTVPSSGSSRQTSATVNRWSSPACATQTTSASGAAVSAAATPPGCGGSTWRIASERRAASSRPRARNRAMPAARRRSVKLPPSGKITKASSPSSAVASAPIWRSTAVTPGREEPVRQAVEHDVDRRVPLQRGGEHDPGLAGVPVDQGVQEQERVAGPGVAAEHQQRTAEVLVRVGALDLHPQPEHPRRGPVEHPEVPADEPVVHALERRRPRERTEPGGEPEPEQRQQARALQHEPHENHPQHAQRPEPSREQR